MYTVSPGGAPRSRRQTLTVQRVPPHSPSGSRHDPLSFSAFSLSDFRHPVRRTDFAHSRGRAVLELSLHPVAGLIAKHQRRHATRSGKIQWVVALRSNDGLVAAQFPVTISVPVGRAEPVLCSAARTNFGARLFYFGMR